ncbi:MAG: sensor histidine kinase [Anaerolineales bacterium]|nr:sensor histidine kinase [Anaerolineales bacterium]
MNRSTEFFSKWIFFLVAGCFYSGVFLRTILTEDIRPELGRMLALLLVVLILSAIEPIITPRWKGYFPIYLLCQAAVAVALMAPAYSSDFYAILFFIPSMLIMLRLSPKIGWLWIGLCALLTTLVLWPSIGAEAIALALVYTAGNVFFGSYALATRRAQAARLQNQALAQELRVANQQLRDYSTQLGQLAVARERNQWARELHDSVTQTVFSMMLATQSASLLFERDPTQVETQLERLGQLANSALSEMQTLISELRPETEPQGGLLSALRKHLADRRLHDGLSVSLEVEGDQPVTAVEEQGLFRIAQEALNNVSKHAQTRQAQLRLHLAEPFWMEVADQGQGFDIQQVDRQGKVGLHSMRERAEEIDWQLHIVASPGSGTCIRVEKLPTRERQA